MTTLNRRLQLAILNRKKGRNALEKGFTLVELMIVIVIVGILSAVALPNFLNQTSKAKATECTSKGGTIMGLVAADALQGEPEGTATFNALVSEADSNSDLCDFTALGTPAGTPTSKIYSMTAIGVSGGQIDGDYFAGFCVNYETGKKKSKTSTVNLAAVTGSNAPSC